MSLKVYVGWDRREESAFDVAVASMLRRTKADVTPFALGADFANGKMIHYPYLKRPYELKDNKLWCPISQAHMSTEFALSRFCVPLIQREGWALFVDCDVVFLDDVQNLFNLADPKYAVMCVKHKQESGPATKMDGQAQVYYNRKNWSSMVLFRCDHPAHKRLTSHVLNTWPGRDLHAFKWLEDKEIGCLPRSWNHLVGIDPPEEAPDAKLLHFTLGGAWLLGWRGGPLDDVWLNEKGRIDACQP